MYISNYDLTFSEVPKKISLAFFAVGCKHNCKDCFNPQLQDFNYHKKWYLDDELFLDRVKRNNLAQGICFLGGDAVFQPKRLIELSHLYKEHYNGYVCLYTGFKYNELSKSIKECCNIIVDGKFNGFPLGEAQSNQKIFVSNKQITYKEFLNGEYNLC